MTRTGPQEEPVSRTYPMGNWTATKGMYSLLYAMLTCGQHRYFSEADTPQVTFNESTISMMYMIEAVSMYKAIVMKDPAKWENNLEMFLLIACIVVTMVSIHVEGYRTKPLVRLVADVLGIKSSKSIWKYMFGEFLNYYGEATKMSTVGEKMDLFQIELETSREVLEEWKGWKQIWYADREYLVQALSDVGLAEAYRLRLLTKVGTKVSVDEYTQARALEGLLWVTAFGRGYANNNNQLGFHSVLELFLHPNRTFKNNWTELLYHLISPTVEVDHQSLEHFEQQVIFGVAPFQLISSSSSQTNIK
jgi:hypothetical protein